MVVCRSTSPWTKGSSSSPGMGSGSWRYEAAPKSALCQKSGGRVNGRPRAERGTRVLGENWAS